MNKIVIFTHRDLDGIAGVALYTYCRGVSEDQYKVVYIEPNDLLKMVRRYYKRGTKYVIIDIGINQNIYDEFKHINLSEVHIEWYDHHIWDGIWVEDFRSKGVSLYIDRSTCATGVVAKNVCRDSLDRVNNIVEIVCGADLWKFNRYESAFLFRYTDLDNSRNWRNKVYEIIKGYLNGVLDNLTSTVEEAVSRYIDEELKVISYLNSKIVKIYTDDVTLCIYVKERHIPSSSIIGNKMISLDDCDIAVIVNESLKSLSFRSRKCNVRELAKIFNGGGHIRAAGAPLSIPIMYRMLKSIGIDIVRKYVADEITKRISESNIRLRSLCQEV